MYNLREYRFHHLKTSGRLWQYCRDKSVINNGNIGGFNANNATTNLFKLKEKIKGETGNNGAKDVEIMVPLKYVSNFWRTLQMLLINCEIDNNYKLWDLKLI